MGLGDVKLAGVLGMVLAYLGWGPLTVGAFGAFVLGGTFAIGLMVSDALDAVPASRSALGCSEERGSACSRGSRSSTGTCGSSDWPEEGPCTWRRASSASTSAANRSEGSRSCTPHRPEPVIQRVAEVPLPVGATKRGEVLEPNTIAATLRELWQVGRFRSKNVMLGVGNQRVLSAT